MTRVMMATLGLAVVGQVLYQFGQRSVPRDLHPLLVLAVAYFVAGTLSFVLAWLMGASLNIERLRGVLVWPTALVALAIVAIEVGFLTAYRSGWTLGSAFAVASTLSVVALALISRMIGDVLSGRQLAGLVLSSLSVWLLVAGPRPD